MQSRPTVRIRPSGGLASLPRVLRAGPSDSGRRATRQAARRRREFCVCPAAKKDWQIFESAREEARRQQLKSKKEWFEWAKVDRPEGLPSNPDKVYKDQGWISWRDWLGYGAGQPGRSNLKTNGSLSTNFRPYVSAQAFVVALSLKGKDEWVRWAAGEERPWDIPSNPHVVYRGEGWEGYGSFLGNERTRRSSNLHMREFVLARAFARSLGLTSTKEWFEYTKTEARPPDIPSNPNRTYHGKGWAGYADWLGFGTVQQQSTEQPTATPTNRAEWN